MAVGLGDVSAGNVIAEEAGCVEAGCVVSGSLDTLSFFTHRDTVSVFQLCVPYELLMYSTVPSSPSYLRLQMVPQLRIESSKNFMRPWRMWRPNNKPTYL